MRECEASARAEEKGILGVELLCNCVAHGTACVVPNAVLVAEKAFVDVLGRRSKVNRLLEYTISDVFTKTVELIRLISGRRQCSILTARILARTI